MVKRPGTITIERMEFDDNSEENIKNLWENDTPCPKINGFSVDFEGWNEGSGSPIKTKEEAFEHVKYLLEQHKQRYNITIINNLEKQKTL